MKKLSALLLAFIMVISVCGCDLLDDDTPKKETGNVSSASSSKPKDETFGLNDTAVFDAIKVTASEIKESEGKSFFTPGEGNVFVGVKFTIENTSDEAQNISSVLLFDAYLDGVKLEYSISAAAAFDGTLDGEITPGKKLVGYYAVEVPKDWKELELQVKSSWLLNNRAAFVFKNK